jgi:hypothetical protein
MVETSAREVVVGVVVRVVATAEVVVVVTNICQIIQSVCISVYVENS